MQLTALISSISKTSASQNIHSNDTRYDLSNCINVVNHAPSASPSVHGSGFCEDLEEDADGFEVIEISKHSRVSRREKVFQNVSANVSVGGWKKRENIQRSSDDFIVIQRPVCIEGGGCAGYSSDSFAKKIQEKSGLEYMEITNSRVRVSACQVNVKDISEEPCDFEDDFIIVKNPPAKDKHIQLINDIRIKTVMKDLQKPRRIEETSLENMARQRIIASRQNKKSKLGQFVQKVVDRIENDTLKEKLAAGISYDEIELGNIIQRVKLLDT